MVKLLIMLLLFCSITAKATTYQIANQSAFNSFDFSTLVAGDIVQFAKGQTFYGSITLSQSGTSGYPITIGVYGSGANPIITGFTTVSAWTNLGSNIWESTNAVSSLSTCNMVTVGDANTAMGRYPNSDATWGGYLRFQSHTAKTSITSSSLTGTPNWTGAEVRVRCEAWAFGKSIITSQSSGTLNFTDLDSYTPQDNWGFFIQNDVRTLDQQNEWYFNPSTKKISVYSTSQPTNVKVASVEDILTINGDYIIFDGLTFSGANNDIIYTTSTTVDHVTIQNCSLLYAGNAAIQLRCAYFDLHDNTIAYINNKAVALDYCSNVSFKSNSVHDIAILAGMGKSGNGTFSGVNGYVQSNVLIEGNTFANFGGAVIEGYGDNLTYKNNFIDTFGSVIMDLGGIYTFVGAGSAFTNVAIDGNIVINGTGSLNGTDLSTISINGIYLDDNSSHVEIMNNSVADCSGFGIHIHNSNTNNIHHNTIFNNGYQLLFNDNSTGLKNEFNTVTNNILVSKKATQDVLFLASNTAVTDATILQAATFDYNYYARPISDISTIRNSQSGIGNITRTIAEWKTYSGMDANSKKSPRAITAETDLQFEYNATTTAKPVTLIQDMMNMVGERFSGTITLQPYTSLVLIKVPNRKYMNAIKPLLNGNKILLLD